MVSKRKGSIQQDAKGEKKADAQKNARAQKKNVKREQIEHSHSAQEFPILHSLGLYAADTLGDGNCLFRAMSDQLYGDENHHQDLRKAAIKELVANRDLYEAFAGVEYGESFDAYVSRMSRDGCYGGHLEIACFAAAQKVEVAIYQTDSVWVLRPPALGPNDPVQRLHIAYHSWEHYSSVRNQAGPSRGLPCVEPIQRGADNYSAGPGQSRTSSAKIPPWQLELALRTVDDADPDHISNLIQELGYDEAVEKLLLDQADRDAQAASGKVTPQSIDDDHDQAAATTSPQNRSAYKDIASGAGGHTVRAVADPAAPAPDTPAPEAPAPSRKQLARRAREQRLKEARERKSDRQRAKKGDKPGTARNGDGNIGNAPSQPTVSLDSEIYI